MNAIVCVHCNERNRVTRPIMVPYIFKRGDHGERRFLWACSFCDSAELWPVFTRSEPPIPKE